jgi:hypothetical protein
MCENIFDMFIEYNHVFILFPGPNPDATTVPQSTAVQSPTPPPTAPPHGFPDACRDPQLDAITQSKSGITYAFKGKFS